MNLFDKAEKKYKWIYSRYRDYKYLKYNLIQRNEKNKLFIGSSYTLFGIVPDNNSVILALQSQDIYYSYKLLKTYFLNNKCTNIMVCLGLGYYALYHDLSMTKSIDENNRIHDIYYPLLHDLHNMPNKRYEFTCTSISFLDKCIQLFVECVMLNKHVNNYFDKTVTREYKARKTWKDVSRNWKDLSLNERKEAAEKRVKGHEKLLGYGDTCEENKIILKKIRQICRDNDCPLFVFIAPMTAEYKQSMSNEYKCKAEELKNYIGELEIELLDFNSCGCFLSDDFVDSDHLNEIGAKKLSLMINGVLRENVAV